MLLLIGCCSVLNVSFKYLNLHGMGIIVVWDTGIIQMDVGCILIPQGCDCCKEMLQVFCILSKVGVLTCGLLIFQWASYYNGLVIHSPDIAIGVVMNYSGLH